MVLNVTEIFFLRQSRLPFGSHHSSSSSSHHHVMSRSTHNNTASQIWNPCFFVVVIHTLHSSRSTLSYSQKCFCASFLLVKEEGRKQTLLLACESSTLLLKNREHKWKTCSSWFLISVSLILGLVILNKAGHVSIEIIFLFLLEYHEYTNTYEYVCNSLWRRWWHNLLWKISHKKYMIFNLTGENILFFVGLNFLHWKWNVLFFHPENLFFIYVRTTYALLRRYDEHLLPQPVKLKTWLYFLHHVSIILTWNGRRSVKEQQTTSNLCRFKK